MIGGRDETMRVVWGQPGVVHIYELKIIIIVISILVLYSVTCTPISTNMFFLKKKTNVHYCAVL